MNMKEIVNQHDDGKWWFWDELWVNEIGPYNTKEDASEASVRHAKTI